MQWKQVALMNYGCGSTGGAKSWSRGWEMAWGKTLLGDNTYKATTQWGPLLSLMSYSTGCLLENGKPAVSCSLISMSSDPRCMSPSLTDAELQRPRASHGYGRCLSQQWRFMCVDGGSLNLFRSDLLSGFIYLLSSERQYNIWLIKVSFRFAIIVTTLFSFCYVRWLLRKLKLAPKVRLLKGINGP